MSGIYIHIPYCKQACHYCDFHFSTNLGTADRMLAAIEKEIELRKDYLKHQDVDTIYFGGGTPSIVSEEWLTRLLTLFNASFNVSKTAEITIEANPDDLTKQKLQTLKQAGFNRLSIGIQTFDPELLTFLNRAHNATQALDCVPTAQQEGFDNISIDLIYAIPGLSIEDWETEIQRTLSLQVQHISTYSLTIEPRTVFGHRAKKGELEPVSDDVAALQFETMVKLLKAAGFDHYEVSNFGLPNYYSQHNTSYWRQVPYLGLGPGAHSFDGTHRQYSVSNNMKYIRTIEAGALPVEKDILTPTDRLNEYLMTGLRTKWGIDLNKIKEQYNQNLIKDYGAFIGQLEKEGHLILEQENLVLTASGFLLADKIAEELFYPNES